MKIEFTDQQIQDLRIRLKKFYGSIAIVAERVDKSPDWVSRMLRGKASRMDVDIINIALDVCNDLERMKNEKIKKGLAKMERMGIR